ncbi:alpha/beta fold hydrolase [Agromyces bauzanensis]
MTVPPIALTDEVGPAGALLVVLGSSIGTSTILWEQVVPLLADRFRVVAWDLPGHGHARPATEPFTVGELADAVAQAVSGSGPVFYAGVSLGGAVGLELLLRHPELVKAAAIIASGAKLGEPEGWRDRATQVRAQSTSTLIIGSAQRWFAPGSIEREPELTGRLLHVLQDADDESYALCCDALAEYDVRDRLGEITAPVLAVWGEHDFVTPEASAQEIASGVQDGRTARIAGAAHLPPAEQSAATAEALRSFFETKG